MDGSSDGSSEVRRATWWKLHLVWVVAAVVLVARAWPNLDTVVDDAFISARYARNFALGHGLVYNLREPPVEGISNLLWTVLLAAAQGLPARSVMTKLGLLFAVLTLPAVVLLTDRLVGKRSWWSGWPAVALALSPAFAVSATNGLETAMFTAAVTWACWATLAAEGRWRVPAALLVASLGAIRPEGLALTGALVAYDVWSRRERLRSAQTWVYPVVALAVFLSIELWRWTTYGALVPNTVAAKVDGGGTFAHLARNWDYLTRGEGTYWPAHGVLLVVALVAADRGRLFRWVLAAMCLVVLASMLRVFEWMPCGRLLVPVVPLELALVASAGAALTGSLQRGWAVVAAVAALAGLEPGMERRCRVQDQRLDVLPPLEIAGRHLKRHVPAGEAAYVFDAGSFAHALGPRITVCEAHPRALTRPHPDGAAANFLDYTPKNPGIIALTTIVSRPDMDSSERDDRMWRTRDAEYHYLGRIEMHRHRVYDVFTRADLEVPPLPPEIVRSWNGLREGAVIRSVD